MITKLCIYAIVRADDEDFDAIAKELKNRLEAPPVLQQEKVKAIVVTTIEREGA